MLGWRLHSRPPTLITQSAGRNHLPVPATPLVGRGAQLTAIRARLLRADGTWFVDLSTITDASLVIPAIALVLGIREDGQLTEIEHVKAAVRDRHLLLVLDNFEQVLTAAVELTELLAVGAPLEDARHQSGRLAGLW